MSHSLLSVLSLVCAMMALDTGYDKGMTHPLTIDRYYRRNQHSKKGIDNYRTTC